MEFDVVLPHVMPYANGCGEPVAIHHIRQAAISLCQRTKLWRHESSVTVTAAGNDALVAPVDAEIYEIEGAYYSGRYIDPISRAELKEKYSNWRDWTPGDPQFITQAMPDSIRLVPSFDGVVVVDLFLQSSEQAETLPDFMSKYARVLGWGALAEILLLPNKPFSNPELAMLNQNRFADKLDSLSTQFVRGQQRAPARTVARFF